MTNKELKIFILAIKIASEKAKTLEELQEDIRVLSAPILEDD